MNTAVVNVKVHKDVKKQAQKVAAEMGVSLSALINGFLKRLIKTKTVRFSTREEPSAWMIKELKKSREDIKAGRISPPFDNTDDAIAWLNDPKARYQNGDRV